MFSDPLFIAAAIAVAVVAGILALGISTFAKGGQENGRRANKIMQWRLAAQFLAVVLILFFLWMRSGG